MKQTVVDRYVDDLAYTLGVNRDDLNVVGSPWSTAIARTHTTSRLPQQRA